MKPRVFIGSATKTLDVASALQHGLESRNGFLVTVWDQGVFGLSTYPLPTLVGRTKDTDFAIMVVGRDEIKQRPDGTTIFTPNANVVFELGLFIGALGIDRVYVVVPAPSEAAVELPSDLNGLTVARYDPEREDGNLDAAVASAVRKVAHAITAAWPALEKEQSRRGRVQVFEAFNDDFERLASTSTTLEVGFVHSRRWREMYGDTLKRRIISGEISTATFLLPDVTSAALRAYLSNRFSDGPAIPGMVYDAFTWVLEASAGTTTVETHLFQVLPAYSFYKFDKYAIIALYPSSKTKKPVPSIGAKPNSETWSFLERDIPDFKKECRLVGHTELRAICAKFERTGRF